MATMLTLSLPALPRASRVRIFVDGGRRLEGRMHLARL